MSQRDVALVLEGHGSNDDLSPDDQDAVRAAWQKRAARLRQALNFETEFIAARESWTEGDENGTVVRRGPVS